MLSSIDLSTPCRLCGATNLKPVLSLGATPLANRLLTAEQLGEHEPRFPLDVAFCPDCTLVQITSTPPLAELFGDYPYFSSYSDEMLAHAVKLTNDVLRRKTLGSKSLVIELGSNDGYLLKNYVESGVPVLGIDPARNAVHVAWERHRVPTECAFFGRDVADRLFGSGVRADVVHAHNVLAHVEDLNEVISGVAKILKPDGIAIIEVPYVKNLLDQVEFDTIYHEHRCYFSLTALRRLFARNGLVISEVERLSIHGGSLRVIARRESPELSDSVIQLLKEEREWGVGRAETYSGFGRQVEELRGQLCPLVKELKRQGKRIAAYGASAKGTTLLSYCELGKSELDWVADRSAVKQGKFTPGTHLQIHGPEKLIEEMPDYVLLLTWNFKNEILAQQAEYRRRGGRFIVPVPVPEIV